jgi:hypothetical protein
MQRWEYMQVRAADGMVMQINYRMVATGGGLFSDAKGESIISYLNRCGQEGWEIAGIASHGGEKYEAQTIFLKRLLL